jgi:hypothetical protein
MTKKLTTTIPTGVECSRKKDYSSKELGEK